MAASEVFSGYESEWLQVKESVNLKLSTDCKQQRGEKKKATLRRIAMELDEADEIIEQMEIEGKGKARCMMSVRSAKSDVKALRAAVQKEQNTSDRDALLDTRPDHQAYDLDVDESLTYSHSAAQRSRLLQSTGQLKSTDARLSNAQRLALESEEIGGGVLESLRGQGAQLANARDELGQADNSVGKATGTLKKMIRTMYKTRIMLYSFIVALIFLIGIILFFKFR